MRKKLFQMKVVALGLSATLAAAIVVTGNSSMEKVYASSGMPIDSRNFPDKAFREYVESFDTDDSDTLSAEEMGAVKEVDVTAREIKSLEGIEYFTELETLICDDNNITELDLSKNKKLDCLYCGDNELTNLNISKNVKLTSIFCQRNRLRSLDLSGNPELTLIVCDDNLLTSLDVTKCEELCNVSCDSNYLEKLFVNNDINRISCKNNRLTSIDLSRAKKLDTIDCSNNRITKLDLKNNKKLLNVNCDNNQLASLDIAYMNESDYSYSIQCEGNISTIEAKDGIISHQQLVERGIDVSKIASIDGATIQGTTGNQFLVVPAESKRIRYKYKVTTQECEIQYSTYFTLDVVHTLTPPPAVTIPVVTKKQVPAEKKRFTDKKTGYTYKVTKSKAEVAFVKAKKNTKNVNVPETVKMDGVTYKVTSISAKAGKNNKKLKSIIIGKNVKKIGKSAFEGCKKLKTVSVKATKIKSVGKNAWKNTGKKVVVKTAKNKVKTYKKAFKKAGISKKAKFKKVKGKIKVSSYFNSGCIA